MLRVIPVVLTGLCLATLMGRADDSADIKTLLEQSIQAHGGEANLAKLQVCRAKVKGTMVIQGQNVKCTSDVIFQMPTKSKNTLKMDVMGMKFTIVQVTNGSKAWATINGEIKNYEGDELKAIQEEVYSNYVETLVPLLKDKAFTFGTLPEVKVNDKAAVGIRVKAKDRPDIDLFFDKDTHYLVRVVRRAYDSDAMKDTTLEAIYSDFRDFNGVKQPAKTRINKDDKKFVESVTTMLEFLDRVDPAEFTKSL